MFPSKNTARAVVITFIGLGSPGWAVHDQSQGVGQEHQDQRPAHLPRVRGPINVGHAIHDVQIDQIAIVLKLSPEQEAAIRSLRDAYETDWLAALPHEREQFIATNEKYKEEYDKRKQFNLTELAEDLRRLATVLRVELRMRDEVFFSQIEAMLTDDQRSRMQRVRNWRKRHLLATRMSERHEAAIDLMELIRIDSTRQRREYSTPPNFITVTDEEYDGLQPAMDAYEPMLIAAMKRAVETTIDLSDLRHRGLDLSSRLMEAGATPDSHPIEHDERWQMRLAYGRKRIAPMQRLERVNRAGLHLFMEHLPPEKAIELRHNYYTTAYPTVYPDRGAAGLLFDVVLDRADLDDDQRDAISDLQGVWRLEHDALCMEMHELEREQFLENRRDWQNERLRSQLYLAISDAGMARERLNREHVELMTQILQPKQIAGVLVDLWKRERQTGSSSERRRGRSRRTRESPPPIMTALVLRAIPSDAQREQIMMHVEQVLANGDVERSPAERAAARLVTFDEETIDIPRPWHQPTWVQRAMQYDN